jgi:serine/threonine protein kinase
MPAPSTNDEFLDLVRKSGVVDEKRLAAHVDKLRETGQLPADPAKLAAQLVRDGILTHFQAEQFLQGKWRRFTIGKYKVLERIGSGGMGTVYLCEHLMMRRRVALKILPADKAKDASALERFYREARAVAALDHPNIVRAYDIDQDDNLHFLVMEHVDGSSLQEIIKRAGPMDHLRAAHYIRQAALGLQHAHDTAALVHRDIKPGNILVDRNGIVKVLDMGLARFFHDEEDVLTKKYDENVLGTADYLAPEQAIDSHGADIRADIYSLGGTFYFCLTGRTPFAEGTVAQKLIWHQTRQPRSIRSIRPEVPEGIASIIDRMMAKDRSQRYQTPQEAADALAPWTQTPIPPPPENEMPQFSLAAAPRSMVGGETLSSSTKPSSDVPPPPAPRRAWQVAGGPPSPSHQGNTTAPSLAPSTQPDVRPVDLPVPSPVPVAAARNTATRNAQVPAAAPALVGNGARSQQIAVPPKMELPEPTRPAVVSVSVPAPAPAPPVPVQPAAEEAFPDMGITPATVAVRRRTGRGLPKINRSTLLLLAAGLAALLLVCSGALVLVGLFSGWFSSGSKKVPSRKPIVVGPSGLAAALRNARAGDRIVLSGDLAEANVWVAQAQSGVTIEGEEGKKVVWRCPEQVQPDSKLLFIEGATNVTVKNITFDGGGKTEALILLFAKCSGTHLQDLKLRNTKNYGVLIANCEGSADNKVVLRDLDFETGAGQTAIRFKSYTHAKAFLVNRFFRIRDCAFNGPGDKITTAKEKVIDRDTIDLPSGMRILVK